MQFPLLVTATDQISCVNSFCVIFVAVTNSHGSVSGKTWSWTSRCVTVSFSVI